MPIIRRFRDGTCLSFSTGRFDDYLVSFCHADGRRISSPKDVEFLEYFVSLGNNEEVWNAIQQTAAQINKNSTLDSIRFFTLGDSLEEEKMFSAHAAAMIAEENKKGTRLGKRIKLIASHQALIQGMDPNASADWSRKDLNWQDVDRECRKYGS